MKAISSDEFEHWFSKSVADTRFPEAYNGYYDARLLYLPSEAEESDLFMPDAENGNIEEIFSAQNSSLGKQIQAASADLHVLKLIESNEYPVKTFDFDGVKYEKEEVGKIVADLEKEINELSHKLRQNDLATIRYFVNNAKEREKLTHLYREYFSLRRQSSEYLNTINFMLGQLRPLSEGSSMSIEEVQIMISKLKNDHEPLFKKELQQWLQMGAFGNETGVKEMAEKFLAADYVYFSGGEFFDIELATLNTIAQDSWDAIMTMISVKFRQLAEVQLEQVERKAA